jgi:hypothetical protein
VRVFCFPKLFSFFGAAGLSKRFSGVVKDVNFSVGGGDQEPGFTPRCAGGHGWQPFKDTAFGSRELTRANGGWLWHLWVQKISWAGAFVTPSLLPLAARTRESTCPAQGDCAAAPGAGFRSAKNRRRAAARLCG